MGPTGFTVFQLLVGGTVLAALVHLLFIIQLIWTLATGSFEANAGMLAFSMASLAAGYSISMIVGAIGLWRRRLMGCAWVLALMAHFDRWTVDAWVYLALHGTYGAGTNRLTAEFAGELFGAHHPARLAGQRAVDGHVIRLGQQFVQLHLLGALGADLLGRQHRVVGQHAHLKNPGAPRHLAPDSPEAN